MYRHVCGAPVLGLLFLCARFEIRGGFSDELEWLCNQGNEEVGARRLADVYPLCG